MKAKPTITPTIAIQARLNAVTTNKTIRIMNSAHFASDENHSKRPCNDIIFFSSQIYENDVFVKT